MRLLIDTHLLIWALASPERLPAKNREQLEAPENEVLVSAASIWEIAIKARLGRIALPMQAAELSRAAAEIGFTMLPITAEHAAGVESLPLLHRDPFDRLLIAQALHEPARFLTADRLLTRYSDLVELVG